MAQSLTPQSVGTDGNLRIHFVEEGVGIDPLSAADVIAGVDVTYYLKTFSYTQSETNIEDPRLTLATTPSKPGPTTYTFEMTYVFGDETDDAAREALTKGTQGWFVIRWAHDNAATFAAGQIVDVVPVEAGSQRKDTPAANSQFTITQAFGINGVPQEDVTLIA